MKVVINKTTGKKEVQFTATLSSISEDTYKNSNDKEFKRANVTFVDAKGREQKNILATVYKSNYDHGITVGEDYLTTMTLGDDGKPYLQMSHLQGGNVADVDMFGDMLSSDVVSEANKQAQANVIE